MGIRDPSGRHKDNAEKGLPPLDSDEHVSVNLDFSPELAELSRGRLDEEETQDSLSEMSFQIEYSPLDRQASSPSETTPAARSAATATIPTAADGTADTERDEALEYFVEQNEDRPREQVTDLWTLVHWLAQIVQQELPVPAGARPHLQLEPTIRGQRNRMRTSFGYLWNSARFNIEMDYSGTELNGISVNFGFTADHALEGHALPATTSSYRSVKGTDGHVFFFCFEGVTTRTDYGAEILTDSTMDDLHRFAREAVQLAQRLGLQ